MIQHLKKQDDAVSPVIGVMLMIVITVVIAAVITVFATGVLGNDSDITPMVMIEIDEENIQTSGYILTRVDFIHKGGDVLLWENIEVSLVGDKQIITNYFPGDHGTLTMAGESGPGVAAEAGDYITVTVIPGMGNPSIAWNGRYTSGEDVVWTMYDKRTDGIIASGKFVVP